MTKRNKKLAVLAGLVLLVAWWQRDKAAAAAGGGGGIAPEPCQPYLDEYGMWNIQICGGGENAVAE